MGANRETKGTYYHIFKGRIAKKVKEPTEYSETRQNKNDKTVHEEFFSSLQGQITQITMHEHQTYGDQYSIVLVDEDGITSILQLSGSDMSNFMKIAPNISFAHPLLFSAAMLNDKSSIFIRQTEGKDVSDKGYVRHFYHKDNLPAPVKDAKGKWNYADQEVFLEEKFQKIMLEINSGEFITDPGNGHDVNKGHDDIIEVDGDKSTDSKDDNIETYSASDLPF